MKVLLTNFHPGRGGGHDTYIEALARGLRDRLGICVAAPSTSTLFSRIRAMAGVTAVPMSFPGKLKEWRAMVPAIRDLKTLVLQERFDVIHVNGAADHKLAMVATAALGAQRPRIVLTKHNSIPVKPGLTNRLRARFATDEVIAVSASTAAMMKATPYGRCRITVIKNGVDVERFSPLGEAEARQRRMQLLGADRADKLVLGTVTGFEWYKGTMDMVEAVASLPQRARDRVHIVVAGIEPTAEQWRIIDQLGMRPQISAVGLVEDVRDYIPVFDLGFVLSYAVETVSFACREMMAMGKPVMVARYAGLPENIDDGADGWIVEPRAVEEVAGKLADIARQRATLVPMGSRARAKAEAEFSDHSFIQATEEVYRRLCA